MDGGIKMDNILAGKLIERISNFTDYNVNIWMKMESLWQAG